jgi:hypothetical protein
MAPDNFDSLSTRERLEFLLDSDVPGSTRSGMRGKTAHINTPGSSLNVSAQRRAFWAGVAFSGLIASSILITHYIDGRLQPSATEGSSASTEKVDLVAATGTKLPAVLDAASGLTRNSPHQIEAPPLPMTGPVPAASVIGAPAVMTSPVPPQPISSLTKVPGFGTSRSVITGVADPQTLTASYYWTFTLRNTTRSPQEAQMNIALPDGAVVSRATLWINGKAQEAAFNSTETVEQAYDWIVKLHRDPLLIKQIDAKHISLKASPVMPNKEMKIRIGMTVPMSATADGSTQMSFPQIKESNLDTSCVQNVHITSNAPIFGNDTHMTAGPHKAGYLLRGNLTAKQLSTLQVTMTRDVQMSRFATRATHSFPASFIVGELQPDSQGLKKLMLSKVETKPDCAVLNDDDAAFRLSYLWAKTEIDRLIQDGERDQAVELATVYRVVSPVSGAVVLERNSDYDYNGLDRNLYRSLSYRERAKHSRSSGRESQPGHVETQSAPPGQSSYNSSVPVMDDLEAVSEGSRATGMVPEQRRSQSYTETKEFVKNKVVTRSAVTEPKAERARKAVAGNLMPPPTAMPQAKRLQAHRVSNTKHSANSSLSQEMKTQPLFETKTQRRISTTEPQSAHASDEGIVSIAGPVGIWLQHSSPLRENVMLTTALLLSCIGLTFAGSLSLLTLAAMRRGQRGASQFAAAGLTWLFLAACWPLFSQVTFVVFGLAFLAQSVWKAGFTSRDQKTTARFAGKNLQA